MSTLVGRDFGFARLEIVSKEFARRFQKVMGGLGRLLGLTSFFGGYGDGQGVSCLDAG